MKRRRARMGMGVLLPLLLNVVVAGVALGVTKLGGWTGNVWLPLQVFGVLTVAAARGYGRTLTPLSALALEKREVLLAALAESDGRAFWGHPANSDRYAVPPRHSSPVWLAGASGHDDRDAHQVEGG